MNEVNVQLSFSVMSDSLEEQLNKQGFTLNSYAEPFEILKNEIYQLFFDDLLTETELYKVLKRLHKKVMGKVKVMKANNYQ